MVELNQADRVARADGDDRRALEGFIAAIGLRWRQARSIVKLRRLRADRAINRVEYRVFSQHREDGIIDHLLRVVGTGTGRFVEFGFAPHECNCLNLMVKRRFSGVFLDGSESKCHRARAVFRWLNRPNVRVVCSFLTRETINAVIAECGVTGEIDVLSIDVDGNDYWLWEALRVVSPRIVVIEYNASFGPDRSVTVPYDREFVRYERRESGFYHGASLAALERLGDRLGYRLVACDYTGVNAFFLRRDLHAPSIPTASAPEAYRPNRGRTRFRRLTLEDQFAQIQHLPMVTIDR